MDAGGAANGGAGPGGGGGACGVTIGTPGIGPAGSAMFGVWNPHAGPQAAADAATHGAAAAIGTRGAAGGTILGACAWTGVVAIC